MALTRPEFERLALEQLDIVDRVARSMTRGDAGRAEDLVQETYVRAIRAWSSFEMREHGIRPWLLRILHNLHATRSVREARQPVATDAAALEDAAPVRGDEASDQLRWEANEELQRAMDSLPSELRLALEHWAVDGLSYQEMADAMDIPIGTVMSRLHRAKRLLREAYERRARIIDRPGGLTKGTTSSTTSQA